MARSQKDVEAESFLFPRFRKQSNDCDKQKPFSQKTSCLYAMDFLYHDAGFGWWFGLESGHANRLCRAGQASPRRRKTQKGSEKKIITYPSRPQVHRNLSRPSNIWVFEWQILGEYQELSASKKWSLEAYVEKYGKTRKIKMKVQFSS